MKKSMRTLSGFERETKFTKWLSKNLGYIEALIDAPIMDDSIPEYPIGDDRLDILAKTCDGRTIAIENQYGVADNEHFGKLMEYAAYVDADIIILISEAVYAENFNTMKWLNKISTDKEFYHIIVEARNDCKIPHIKLLDDSDIVRRNKKNAKKTASVFASQLEKFWNVFDSCVKNNYPEFAEKYSYNAKKKEKYITVTPTRLKKSYNFNVVFRTSLNEYYAELKFSEKNFDYFKYMEEHKDFLEAELNEEVEFHLMGKSASITLKNKYKGYIDSEICYEKYALSLIESIIELDKVAYLLEKKYQQGE